MVPDGWKLDRLGNVAEVNPRTRIELIADETVAFLAMADVSNESRVNEYQIRKYSEVSFGFTAFSRNDVLVAKITPCFENGKGAHVANLPTSVGFGSTEFHVVREQAGKSDARFIHYLVNSATFRITGASNMQGSAGQKRVPTDFLRNFRTLVPPLPEQQKIAEILSTWDRAIETTEALLANARTQKRALMQSLLTGTRRFPGFEDHPWREVRLGDVASLVTKGTTPTSIGFEFTNHGVLFVKAENIDGSGTVAQSDVYVSQECHDALRRSQLEGGDILVTIAGAIGRVGLVPEEILPANTNQAVAIIRVPSDADISRSFVSYWIRGPFIQSILRDTAAGGAQPNVNLAQISNLPMKCPTSKEQELIVAAIDDATLQVEKCVQQLDHLRTEKKSLMQQLLTGKRRVVV